jgi:serine/threonine protein kinase
MSESSEEKEKKIEDKVQNTEPDIKEPTIEEKNQSETDELSGDENKTTKAFKIVRKVGGGAEGAVYLANHIKTQKLVAIKSINVRNDAEAEKLEQEVIFSSHLILKA